jgi:hypothetical protein
MLKLTQRIAEDFEAKGGTSNRGQTLASGQITELLHKHDVGKLRRHVMKYLEFKEQQESSKASSLRPAATLVSTSLTLARTNTGG